MSKKSNLKRTHRKRKTKAYAEAKVAAQREDVAQQQKAAKEAYRAAKGIHKKRVFTAGAKAVIAAAAIMLMFFVGLISWSAVRGAKQRRDDQPQQEQQPSQMVNSEMVTGMGRDASHEMSKRTRFASFAKTDGGYDGKAIFGGRISSEGIDALMQERTRLEEEWKRRSDQRAEDDGDDRYETQSLADKAKSDDSEAGAATDPNASRYTVVETDNDEHVSVSVGSDDGNAESDSETAVTDEQIRKLIDSAEATSSR